MLSLLALASSACWGTADFFAGLNSQAAARRWRSSAWTQGLALLVISVVVAVRHADLGFEGWPPVGGGCRASRAWSGWSASTRRCRRGPWASSRPIAAARRRRPGRARASPRASSPSPWAWVGMLVAVVGVDPGVRARAARRRLAAAGRAGRASPRSASGSRCSASTAARGSRPLLTLWGMRMTSVTVLVVVGAGAAHGRRRQDARTPALLAIGCGDLAANGLFAYASSRGQVSVAAVLGSLYPVVTVIWARFLLDERLRACSRSGWRSRSVEPPSPRCRPARSPGRCAAARWEDVAS